MKKILSLLVLTLCAALLCAAPASGQAKQAKIQTRKVRLSDFPTKTTKVVLAGGELFDNALKEEMARRWLASPYEFCSVDEYEALKGSSDYYFLIPVSTRTRKEAEPGILTLTLLKGGKEKDDDPEKVGFDVISIPCAALEAPSGREFVYLSAFLDIIQRFVGEAMTSDRVSYGGLATYSRKLLRDGDRTVYLSKDDLASSVRQEASPTGNGIRIVEEEEADQVFLDGTEGAMVSYVVAPSQPQKGSVCYKMLISADTHELCYFEKAPVKNEASVGYLPFDLKIISLQRKK
ncbi:MAG: hypothetical protein IJ654_10985 [Bacteroidales bacterium]|nr:hypothetical protein [Bacteroidales bacterium]MBR1576954.1 hypothetical protein [Bacteroidales bacterium]